MVYEATVAIFLLVSLLLVGDPLYLYFTSRILVAANPFYPRDSFCLRFFFRVVQQFLKCQAEDSSSPASSRISHLASMWMEFFMPVDYLLSYVDDLNKLFFTAA